MRAEGQLEDHEEEELQEIVTGLEEGHDDERAEAKAEEELPAASRHFQQVVATMHSVLDGRELDLEQIAELSREERQALEVLAQVVHARGRRGGFIYAEYRLEQLNQVLAVLQPALSIGSAPGLEEVRGELNVVIDEVEELREKLTSLEAAEEELEPRGEGPVATGDKDDEDDGAGEVPEPGAPARPSTLSTGAAVPDRAPAPTTLTTGPAVPDRAPAPTPLVGAPEAPDFTPPPTTLVGGPEAPDFAPGPTTLTGDDDGAPTPGAPASTTSAPAPAKPLRSRKAR